MEFRAEITQTALADAESYFCFIRDESHDSLAAERWWNGLVGRILSLESLPRRCPVIPEQKFFTDEMRHLVYASHRIIFRIDDNIVTVLRIYHGARQPLRAGDQ